MKNRVKAAAAVSADAAVSGTGYRKGTVPSRRCAVMIRDRASCIRKKEKDYGWALRQGL